MEDEQQNEQVDNLISTESANPKVKRLGATLKFLKTRPGSSIATFRKSKRTALPFFAGVLLILVPIIYLSLKDTSQVEATWFDDSWSYRKPVDVSSTNGSAQSNVYISFDGTDVIDTDALVTAGKMQTDCGDLRFVTESGVVLPYYIVANCNNASTDVNVNFDSFPDGDQIIYFYYGNSSAPNVDNLSDFSTEASNYDIGTPGGTEEVGPGPGSYWKFDEGYGTVVNDQTANRNNGNLGVGGSTPSWQSEEFCVDGKCLFFDGTDDYVSVSDDPSLDATDSTGFTVSAWVRSKSGVSAVSTVAAKYETSGADGGYKLYMDADGDLAFGIDDDNTWGPDDVATTNAANHDDGGWHHVVGVKDGTTSLSLYIDGELAATDNTIAATATLVNDDTFYIGIDGDGTSNAFQGFIDEVKTYPYARTAAQVKTDFAKGGTVHGTSVAFGREDESYLSDGLVGYWNLDIGTSGPGQTMVDSSGNGNYITTDDGGNNTGMDCTVAGKFGYGCDLDGTDDYVKGKGPPTFVQEVETDEWTGGEANETTPSFNVQAGDILAAYSIVENADSTYDVTVAGGSLSWTEQQKYDENDNGVIWIAIWTAVVDADKSMSVTFSGHSSPAFGGSVFTFRGSDGVGASAQNDSGWSEGLPSVNITTTQANSAIVVANGDWQARGESHTWRTNAGALTEKTYEFVSLTYTVYGGYHADAGAINTYAVGLTAPSGQRYGIVTVEVKGGNGAVISDAKTISFWAKPDSTTESILDLDGTSNIDISSGTVQGNNITNPKIYVDGVLTTSFPDTNWHHVVVTTESAINADDIKVGRISSNYYSGVLDDVRVYNRVLSPAEVEKLYRWAPGPIGHWKMDENTGTTLYDSSGNGNNSTTWTGNTKYEIGKYGSGLYFDNNNDVVRVVESSEFDFGATTDSYTVSAWFKSDVNQDGSSFIVAKSTSGASAFPIRINNTGSTIRFDIRDGTTTSFAEKPTNYNDGLWHHVAGVRDTRLDKILLYIDGVFVAENPDNTTGTVSNNDDLSIGNGGPSYTTNDFLGSIDDVRIYNYARTPQQIVSDMNAGHPAPGSPVGSALGHWKFDEGYGDTAYDSGTGGIDADLAGSGISCPGSSGCPDRVNDGKFGRGFETDDNSSNYNERVEFEPDIYSGLSEITLSAWVSTTDQGRIIDVWDGVNGGSTQSYIFNIDSSNRPRCIMRLTSTNYTLYADGPGITLSDGNWHHLVCSWDGSEIKIYYDGRLNDSMSASGTMAQKTDGVGMIGNGAASSYTDSSALRGKFDDVRVYNSALTTSQIAQVYNQGFANVMGAASTAVDGSTASNSADRAYCPPGDTDANCGPPVAEYLLDEMSGQTVYDTSGNDNNLTMGPTGGSEASDPTWITDYNRDSQASGRNGGTLHFKRTDDEFAEITSAVVSSLPFTMSAWVKVDEVDSNYFVSVSHYEGGATGDFMTIIAVTNNNFSAGGYQTGVSDSGKYAVSTTVPVIGNWYHVAAVFVSTTERHIYVNGVLEGTNTVSNNPNGFTRTAIGGMRRSDAVATRHDGNLDDVRFYNYERTPAQIAWEYNQGGPVGWWKFDECQGATAYDSSGNNNHGTITEPGGGSNTSIGTCGGSSGEMWADGATGKLNSSLEFDGADDTVDFSTNLSTLGWPGLSVSAWINANTNSGEDAIFSKWDLNDVGKNSSAFYLYKNSSTLYFKTTTNAAAANISTSGGTINTGQWHHVIGTYDGTTMKLYLDGRLLDQTSQADTFTNPTASMFIGAVDDSGAGSPYTNEFDGQIDDIHIFNYGLTKQQVEILHNEGAAHFGGP